MTIEEQLAALTTRLKDLEMQVGQLGEQTPPDTTAATPGPPSTAPAIKVSLPREKRFGKYSGARDDRVLEDWISDAQRALRGQSGGEAVDTLIFHLEGVAKKEVKLRPTSQWSSSSGVFTISREVFSEQLTETQARRKFFARRQGDRESVQDFAHALMVLLSQVERLGRALVTNKDTLLKEQFVENLRDPTLCRDIKHWTRDHSAATFQEVRLEVHRYMEEDPTPRRTVVAREATVEDDEVLCGEVGGQSRHHKVLADLISGQRIMGEEMQKQQKVLMTHIDQQWEVFNRQQDTLNQLLASLVSRPKPNSCFRCGKYGHFVRDCPKPPPGGTKPAPKTSGNGKTPPQ